MSRFKTLNHYKNALSSLRMHSMAGGAEEGIEEEEEVGPVGGGRGSDIIFLYE